MSNLKDSSRSSGLEELYRESIDENLKILMQFPVVFQQACMMSETMLPSEDAIGRIKTKTSIRECLNALQTLARISSELELIESRSS
jgi:hypothetical protein